MLLGWRFCVFCYHVNVFRVASLLSCYAHVVCEACELLLKQYVLFFGSTAFCICTDCILQFAISVGLRCCSSAFLLVLRHGTVVDDIGVYSMTFSGNMSSKRSGIKVELQTSKKSKHGLDNTGSWTSFAPPSASTAKAEPSEEVPVRH